MKKIIILIMLSFFGMELVNANNINYAYCSELNKNDSCEVFNLNIEKENINNNEYIESLIEIDLFLILLNIEPVSINFDGYHYFNYIK